MPLGYLIGYQHRLAEVAVACALFESVLLLIVLVLSVDRARPRAQDRFPFAAELIATHFTGPARARVGELSLAGATLTFDGAPPLSEDRAVRIEIEKLGVAHDETNGSAKPEPASNGPGSTRV